MAEVSAQQWQCEDEAATVRFGASLGRAAQSGGIIYLQGTLGAGKTTLCRGVLRAFGHRGAVKSPTYTLVEPYKIGAHNIFHFDLYRLGNPEELEYMGIRDYFEAGNLCLIEWPERGQRVLPAPDLTISIASVKVPPESNSQATKVGRSVQVQAHSAAGADVLSQLSLDRQK